MGIIRSLVFFFVVAGLIKVSGLKTKSIVTQQASAEDNALNQ